MREIFTFILTACILSGCSVSEKSFATFYHEHKGDKGVINMSIPPKLVKLFIPKEEKQVKRFLAETSSVRIMIKQEPDTNLANELSSCLTNEIYNDLVFIKDGSSTVRITAKNDNKKIHELLITINDSETFVALQLKGNYTFETLRELAKLPG